MARRLLRNLPQRIVRWDCDLFLSSDDIYTREVVAWVQTRVLAELGGKVAWWSL